MLPFLALLLPSVTVVAEPPSANWNASAPLGVPSFDYGSYPALSGDFLRDVPVINCHSHNDYWRDVPLYTGLSYGCISTEADVWLVNGTLLVGHDVASLRAERTFQSLYVDPLVSVLEQKNPQNAYTAYALSNYGHVESNGVFDTDSGRSLQLLVDVKTPGDETWPFVVEALEPLRARGYLSFVNETDTAINKRAITVVGTGDTPLSYLLARPSRDYFFDAPLATLNATFVPTLSPLASTSLRASIGWTGLFAATSAQLTQMKSLVDQAHSQGLLVRIWDNPTWPKFVQNRVWNTFLDLGVDFLNADDLEAVSSI